MPTVKVVKSSSALIYIIGEALPERLCFGLAGRCDRHDESVILALLQAQSSSMCQAFALTDATASLEKYLATKR